MTGKGTTKRYSLAEIKAKIARGEGKTRCDAPEAEQESEEFWKNAVVVRPEDRNKASIHLRVDADVLEWFKAQGKGHLTRMNAVLRSYCEAHKVKPQTKRPGKQPAT